MERPRVSELPQLVDVDPDALSDAVKHYHVGLLNVDESKVYARPIGSGTLTRLGHSCGILTAAHVITQLLKFPFMGILRQGSPDRQRFKVALEHTTHFMIWDHVDGHCPDVAFLSLPPKTVSDLEALGSVFYNLEKDRTVPRKPEMLLASTHAIMGLVGEWTETVPGDKPSETRVQLRTIFGSAKQVDREEVNGIEEWRCSIEYGPESQPPTSYGGVSGGALWRLHAEGTKAPLTRVYKELIGVAFREEPGAGGELQIVSQGRGAMDRLISEVRRWSETEVRAID